MCVCTHVCVHAYTYVGKQRPGQGQVPCPMTLHLVPLKQDVSLNLELSEWSAKHSLSPAVLGL